MSGVSRLRYSNEIRLIRVMCTGRVDIAFVLRAFYNGMDGVLIVGCRLNECNYITHGNYQALNMALLSKRIMEYIGLNPERLRIEFMSSSDGPLFAETVNDFTGKVREFGPLGEGEGIVGNGLKSKLAEVIKLVPYIKMAKRGELASRIKNSEEWDKLFTREEVEELFREVPLYYIDPEKCRACMICLRRCPVEAIDGDKKLIHIINQEKCIKCGNCFEVCPPRFVAVKKIVGEAVPPPISEEERIIVRKSGER